ncbi:MAG: hypothetical protein ACLU8W_03370 [Clostridia bacterium]
MKTGKITAKLRDAVPVCLMVNGEEVKRYKNIELPDELKEVEMTDFHFNVHMDGKITFEIHYEEGILPKVFPEARTRVSRAAKAAAQESTEVMAVEAAEPETEAAMEESAAVVPEEPIAEEAEPEYIEAAYNVTGVRRKQLVVAISEFTNIEPEYKAAPSFAYEIGEYTVDKEGTLTGPENPALIESLKEQGFIAAE